MPTINYDIWQLLDSGTSSAYLSNDPPVVSTAHFFVDNSVSPAQQIFTRELSSNFTMGTTVISQTDGAQNPANWPVSTGGEMINTGKIWKTPNVLGGSGNIVSHEKLIIARLFKDEGGTVTPIVNYYLENGEAYFIYNGTKYTLVDSSNNTTTFADGDAFKMKIRFKGSTLSVYAYKNGVTYSRVLNSTTILAADRTSTARFYFTTGVEPQTAGLTQTQINNLSESKIGWSTVVVNLNLV